MTLREAARRYRRRLFETVGSRRYSRVALNGLEEKLAPYLGFKNGFFVEAGANDGVQQSNTYHLERFQGWRGILIEPVPEKARACRLNRPGAHVFQTALASTPDIKSVKIHAAGLMAFVSGNLPGPEAQTQLNNAREKQNLSVIPEIEVPARPLSDILDEVRPPMIDFFSLDVEGYEVPVLKGMDISRHRPRFLLIETRDRAAVERQLGNGYVLEAQLTHHDYLFRFKS